MRRLFTKRTAIVLGVLAVLGVAASLAFGPVVRARVAKEAARRRLEVEVGKVRPGLFAVRLLDVSVRPEGVPEVQATLPEVRVELGATFAVREVAARGGLVKLEGDPAKIHDSLRAWRSASAGAGEAKAPSRTELRADGLTAKWEGAAGEKLDATGLSIVRDDDGYKIGCESLQVRHKDISVALGVVSVDLSLGGALKSTHAGSVELGWDVPLRADAAPSGAQGSSSNDPAPPPLPLIAAARRGKMKLAQAAPPAQAAPDEPLVALPDLHAARARLAAVAKMIAERVPDGGEVSIDGLSLRIGTGKDRVALGPGPLSIAQRDKKIHLSFSTERRDAPPRPGTTPLALSATLPLEPEDATVSLSGGPIPLSLLGIKEGAAGISDVDRATIAGRGQVILSASGDSLVFDGEIRTKGLSLQNARIAQETLHNIDLGMSGRGLLTDTGHLRVDDAQVSVGAFRVRAHGTMDQARDHVSASMGFEVATASCQSLLDSAPTGMLPSLAGARMSGTFGARGRIAFDSRKLDDLVLEYDIDDQCKMTEVPAPLSRDRFTKAFTYRIYLPDGRPSEATTGPGTRNWADLEQISPFMQVAVLTTEDGAFMRHHGFNHAAIKSSLIANLKARKFIRGASTITMQLAKNLFLSREKTLSRKLEEIILADYLEQVFRKDDMMELYLNVIEFGPNVYGIVQAAEHYFGRRPDELNLAECLFLSSILPSPIRFHRMAEKGELPEYWLNHLHQLMGIAAKTGKISAGELAEGLTEKIEFMRPGAPRPTPRPPVAGAHLFGADDDEWQQLN
jgi:hypothetical protein